MKKLVSIILGLVAITATAQTPLFDEEINIEDYEAKEVLMPPSPLTTQIVFVGGYDVVQTTPTYGNPAGRAIAKEWHDFIGFTPDETGESLGWVGVNHEQIYEDDRIGDGGGMTAFRITKNAEGQIVIMDQTLPDGRQGQYFNVDFVNTVGETGMNCGGIVGPNGRIWTAEEWYRSDMASIYNGVFRGADRPDSWNPHSPAPTTAGYGVRDTSMFTINAPEFPIVDGLEIPKYDNFNYMTEVDLKEAKAIRKQYNWGRAGWEGGAISNDGKYVYLGIDATPAPWVRFEANTPFDFTQGTLTVYKEDNAPGDKWIEVPERIENVFGGLTEFALTVGATMFVRNEWVTIDRKTGKIYWTETGRDSNSSGPGIIFSGVADAGFPAQPGSHHTAIAQERGLADAFDVAYQDYYGRVMFYDPATDEIGVVVNGGPYIETSPSIGEYPSKHLSNPDGLSVLEIDGKSFLMIQEDLNGTSFGRTPDGISNRICELYLLSADAVNADVNDLTRVTAIPAGAEITGAIQIDDNTILVNSQHPNADNPFPFNHSLTLAIHGFQDVTTSIFETPQFEGEGLSVFPNPTTREIHLSETTDFAIYNVEGRRLKVFRNTNQADVSDLATGVYFVKLSNGSAVKLIVQ
ncbi:MAG: alkaline phosphatase PhoX [Bacteroidota bacterium]